jgi:hypothetical protein
MYQTRLATEWTVRGSKAGEGQIFRTRADRPWGPPSLLYSGSRVSFLGVQRSGRGYDHPNAAPRLKKELSYIATPPLNHPPHLAQRLKKDLSYISTPPMDHPPHQAPRLKKQLSYISTPLWTTHPT